MLKTLQFLDYLSGSLTKHGMARSAKPGTIRPLTRRGRKSAVVYLQVEKWRELKVIAALTDSTLDKLLQSGADMVIEKFKRTRSGSLSL
jgi:hypothetical protein